MFDWVLKTSLLSVPIFGNTARPFLPIAKGKHFCPLVNELFSLLDEIA